MNIRERNITPGELNISPEAIAILMGINEDNVPEPYQSMILDELSLLHNYTTIKGGFLLTDNIKPDYQKNIFYAKNILFQPGEQVMKFLKNSESFAFFICTAGEQISKRSRELLKKDQVLESYIADLLGSVIVEEAMDIIHKELSEDMEKQGLKTTNRYSPGYCDWKVDEQHQLFQLFPEQFCGVTLSETALMHPVKSVSGTIGIGKNVTYHKYVCHACTSVNCIYRNLRHKPL